MSKADPANSRRKKPKVRKCQLYIDGHVVHYIQALHSLGRPHRSGRLVDLNGNVLTVEFSDQIKQYRNHNVDRLLERVPIGTEVRVCYEYRILRYRHDDSGSYCFSICSVDTPWTLCNYEPLRSATPEALAERVRTHGGFVVPGKQVLMGLEHPNG